MQILDGIKTSEAIAGSLKVPQGVKLGVILAGKDPASESYVNMKKKRCEKLGIAVEIFNFEANADEGELIAEINQLNKDEKVTGILVQMPLPSGVNARKIVDSVDLRKDVDGLTSSNLAKLFLNGEFIVPCTPKGVLRLADEYHIPFEGKNVCIIGYSDLVGKPLANLCLKRGARVKVCDSKTNDLKGCAISADIIMTATGIHKLITSDMVKKGAVIFDIGISKTGDKVVGDVDFENVKDKCSYITPVPGGVGPMTIISLIENLILLKDVENTTSYGKLL